MSGEIIPALQAVGGATVVTPDASHASLFIDTNYNLQIKKSDGSLVPSIVGTSYIATLVPPVTVANTVTETTILTTTLPANYFANAGKGIKLTGFGFHSATGTPTIQIRVYYGSTVILDTGAVNSGSSTNALFQFRGLIVCNTTGATGTIWSQGFYDETGGGVNRFPMTNLSATTIDTTTANALKVTVQWGTASASNTETWTNLVFEPS